MINTISPNSYGITTRDAVFRQALKDTDFLVLDGVYFALASLLLQGKNIKANQGPDVFYHFMKRAGEQGSRVFFLGSTETTLSLMKDRAAREYPAMKVAAYSPPFKPEFSPEDNAGMVRTINEFDPDVLFVGMTCPKQEKWAISQRENLKAGLVVCIGNVFDWFAGTQKAIHPFWFRIKLGWLVRIFLRPEIFRRNIKNQMIFFWHIVLIFLKLKKT
ncbi:MAG: WecB/TagA/CpsF family glycosyltransferase [Bacteroidales bacterium]